MAYRSDSTFFAKPFVYGDQVVATRTAGHVCLLIGTNNSASSALAHQRGLVAMATRLAIATKFASAGFL